MSSFTDPLVVTPMSDGRNWTLCEEFDYHIGSETSDEYIHVPAGFVTDFASIPRSLEIFLAPWAKWCKASILHDYLYGCHEIMGKPITRKQADDLFLEANCIDWSCHRSGRVVAWIEYLAVRWWGWFAWTKKGLA